MTDLFIFLNSLVFVLDLISGSQLKVMGAKHNLSIVQGEWWRLITANFLHGGALHLAVCPAYPWHTGISFSFLSCILYFQVS